MKTRTFIFAAILLLGACFLVAPLALFSADAPKPAAPPAPPKPTNVVVRATFRVLGEAGRDPFLPVGYKKPAPLPPGQKPVEQRPRVEINLTLSSVIWLPPDNISAVVEGSPVKLRAGNSYDYDPATKTTIIDPGTRATIKYKVLRITESSITIQYDEEEGVPKEKEFQKKTSDLNIYTRDPDDPKTSLDTLSKEKE